MAVIAGNWKMHMAPEEARAFFSAFEIDEIIADNEVLIFPPTISLVAAYKCEDRDPRIQLGIQNVHWEDCGAFTGEISAEMAASAGASYALVGHSERRQLFGETDEQVALKVVAALRQDLIPVICVGETLEEREAGQVSEVILKQLDLALASIPDPETRFLIAYEPVWAIGTGKTATPMDAAGAHGTLRDRLEQAIGVTAAARTEILYGGSVQPSNTAELLAAQDVDGVLVGGASINPQSFGDITRAAG